MAVSKLVTVGENAAPAPGDLIFCHRRGFSSWAIRTGEKIRFRQGAHWSHVAIYIGDGNIIEALTRGVKVNPLSVYRDIEYVHVRTGLEGADARQAVGFALSCVGWRYGYLNDLGIALRFLSPGHGLWFGMNGTEICSGLAAQALCRGWYVFNANPASMSPAELAIALGVPQPRPYVRPALLGATS